MQNPFQKRADYSRSVVLFSYGSLLAVFTLNTLVVPSCNREPNPVIWMLHLATLLIFLPGVINRNLRTHAWMTFMLLGHFLATVSTVFACTSALLLIEVALISSLFIATMLYIRWRSKQLKFTASAT